MLFTLEHDTTLYTLLGKGTYEVAESLHLLTKPGDAVSFVQRNATVLSDEFVNESIVAEKLVDPSLSDTQP